MEITCDASFSMGYITLMPILKNSNEDKSLNDTGQNIGIDAHIPYIVDEQLASRLDEMEMMNNTFKHDYDKVYQTEYGNDLDEHGFIIGIELTLSKERLKEQIQHQAFKVMQTIWHDHPFHVVTFDYLENVFRPDHIMYKLTEDEDAFVIVKLEDPAKLGIFYENADKEKPIALIKGLVSARDDLYNLDYLLKPEFYLI